MQLIPGDTAAFDKGYCNYKNFGTFCEKGIFFVTRLKENAQYTVVESRLTNDPYIPTDETIIFTGKKTKNKCPHQFMNLSWTDVIFHNLFGNHIRPLINNNVSVAYMLAHA